MFLRTNQRKIYLLNVFATIFRFSIPGGARFMRKKKWNQIFCFIGFLYLLIPNQTIQPIFYMRIRTFLVPLIAGTIFISSCSKNVVTLSYTNAKGEVPQLGNLIFRFNKSIVTDSMLNTWDSTDYISFNPAIKGKFRWESPDQLVFSPSQPLNPACRHLIHCMALPFVQ